MSISRIYPNKSRLEHRGWLKKNWGQIFFILLLLGDWIGLNLSILLTLLLVRTAQASLLSGFPLQSSAIAANAAWIGSFLLNGLYRQASWSSQEYQLAQRRKALIWGVIFFTLIAVWIRVSLHPVVYIIFLMLYVPIGLTVFLLPIRINQSLAARGWGTLRTVIVGVDETAAQVFARLTRHSYLRYEILGFLDNTHISEHRDQTVDYMRIINEVHHLDNILEHNDIDLVIIAAKKLVPDSYVDIVSVCEAHNVGLKLQSPETDKIMHFPHIHDAIGIPLVIRRNTYNKIVYPILKRCVDFFLSLMAILILLPLFILISLAILVSNPGPVLFVQRRRLAPGCKEVPFIKFRTMVVGADSLKYSTLMNWNESDGALFKLKEDPRIHPVGRFLRRYSLDELPQLFSVLLGQMTLVGPRPLPSRDFDAIASTEEGVAAFYEWRKSAKPGITGLWQVSGRSELSFTDMILLDFYYIESRSLLFDFELMMETVPVILFRKGAY